MSYIVMLMLVGFVMGLVGVASHPAPYFGALGLVVSAGAACSFLSMHGMPFLAMVLFLIYLGGMLVVFGYSSAMAADPYPQTWGDVMVLERLVFLIMLLVAGGFYVRPVVYGLSPGVLSSVKELMMVREDVAGVAMFYSMGGMFMLFCGWVLLLTLFVVLELTRGRSRGSLRAP